jgi:hypothetical protein
MHRRQTQEFYRTEERVERECVNALDFSKEKENEH